MNLMFWLLAVLLLGAPLVACILMYVIRWYEGCNARVQTGEPLPALWHFLLCPLQAWGSLLCMYCLYPLRLVQKFPALPQAGTASRSGPGAAREGKPPVLLVHPALHNAAAWVVFRHYLAKAGYHRLYFFDYSCRNNTFAEVSSRLAAHIDALVAACPGEKPIVMGASLGALLLRSALSNVSEATRRNGLGGCITLACPHAGTRLAPLAPAVLGPVLGSISWRGSVVQQIQAQENIPPMPFVAFSSPMDEMVIPQQALTPPAGWQVVRTRPISHISIMLHVPTIRRVVAALARFQANAHGGGEPPTNLF